MSYCVYCSLPLENKKKKYCNELCKYRYLSIKNDKPTGYKIAQNNRMIKAGRKQRAGKIGCRYN